MNLYNNTTTTTNTTNTTTTTYNMIIDIIIDMNNIYIMQLLESPISHSMWNTTNIESTPT